MSDILARQPGIWISNCSRQLRIGRLDRLINEGRGELK